MNEKKLGRYLKGLRKSKGYTQEFVASNLGISRQAYSHYETNRAIPPNDICYKIASLYSISPDDLIAMSLFSNESSDENNQHEFSDTIEEFLSYLENSDNTKKLRFLSANEKELLFYFDHLCSEDQHEIMEIIKLKLRLSKS